MTLVIGVDPWDILKMQENVGGPDWNTSMEVVHRGWQKRKAVSKGEGGPEDEGALPFPASELLLKLFPSSSPTALHTHTFPTCHCPVQMVPPP